MKAPPRASDANIRRHPWLRFFLITLVVLVALLLAIRFIGSPLATKWANKKLASLPGYTGHVGAIQLALWRGAITGHNFVLREKSSGETVVQAKSASLFLALTPMLKGKLGGRGTVDELLIKIVKTTIDPKPEKKDAIVTPQTRAWQTSLQEASPFEVSRFALHNSRIEFVDRTISPNPKLNIDQLELEIAGLTNRKEPSAPEFSARAKLTARVASSGRLMVDVRANPTSKTPRFASNMELTNLSLIEIHDLLLAYALIDAQRGTFEVFSEVNATSGQYDGYVKPFFRDLEFKAVSDPNKNLAQRAATKVAAAVTNVLKNENDKVATKAPFKGDFQNTDVDVWTTVENLLRNAFVQSLREGLEGHSPGPSGDS
jgi:hypothetical protein